MRRRSSGLGETCPDQVVVGQDDRRGVLLENLLHDLAGMDRGSVNGAPEKLPVGQDAVLLVEKDHGEDLVGQVPQSWLEKR